MPRAISFALPHPADVHLGFVPLLDAAPLILALELGYFGDEGLQVALHRQIGWGNVRDKLVYGQLHASHALVGMPPASVLGRDRFPEPVVAVMSLGTGGNAITFSRRLIDAGVRGATDLATWLSRRSRGAGSQPTPPTFAHVFSCSSHHYLLRAWLASAGVDPDRDVRLAVLPPPQMATQLLAGALDGFCAGEPWGTLAEACGAGAVVAATTDVLPGHPEKVLAVNRHWAARSPQVCAALVRAVLRACAFCHDRRNAGRVAEVLGRPGYLDLPADLLARSLAHRAAPRHDPASTSPDAAHAAWLLTHMTRWGHLSPPPQTDIMGAACAAVAPEIYRQAAVSLDIGCPSDDTASAADDVSQTLKGPGDPMNVAETRKPMAAAMPSRRTMLKAAGGSALAAMIGSSQLACDSGSATGAAAPAAYAGEGPEVRDLKFGIIALTDCSPIVIAHEKGLFKKYGINSTVNKGASWAAIRDMLSNGDIQATHMLTGMPIASTMGLGDAPKKPMVIPWMLNRNGQSITLKKELMGKVQADPKALKPFVDEAKAAAKPMTFAMTFPPGTHAMWTRYWLGAGGINADKDVSLITIPPAQMVANMKVGKMDGFCVGEPWNARSVAEGIGFTATNTQDIWKDHPEKVCAFTAEFADKNPKTVKAVLKALHEASVWLDDMNNRPEQCAIVSKANYINCPPDLILGRMQGKYDFGDGRKVDDPNYMIFSQRNCNYPQPKYAVWWLTQFRRWGMVAGTPDYEGVANQVMRTDIYEEAMKELGYDHGGRNDDPETLFDGVTFDSRKPDEYATGFKVHSMKV